MPSSSTIPTTHAAILNTLSQLRSEIDGLQRLNVQTVRHLKTLIPEIDCPLQYNGCIEEAHELIAEIRVQDLKVKEYKQVMDEVSPGLAQKKQGLPKPAPLSPTTKASAPAGMCEYCASEPADTEYTCCHYIGTCALCTETLQRMDARCPNCGTSDPILVARL